MLKKKQKPIPMCRELISLWAQTTIEEYDFVIKNEFIWNMLFTMDDLKAHRSHISDLLLRANVTSVNNLTALNEHYDFIRTECVSTLIGIKYVALRIMLREYEKHLSMDDIFFPKYFIDAVMHILSIYDSELKLMLLTLPDDKNNKLTKRIIRDLRKDIEKEKKITKKLTWLIVSKEMHNIEYITKAIIELKIKKEEE